MMQPDDLPPIGELGRRFPRMRLLVDHLGVLPHMKLPEAAAHVDALLELAATPNVAVKASALPSMATDPFPFSSTHDMLRTVVRRFGAERVFWGSDVTRLHCTWAECVRLFTEALPWLHGRDLELVMGEGVEAWIGRT